MFKTHKNSEAEGRNNRRREQKENPNKETNKYFFEDLIIFTSF
jgi:hypothetical protein